MRCRPPSRQFWPSQRCGSERQLTVSLRQFLKTRDPRLDHRSESAGTHVLTSRHLAKALPFDQMGLKHPALFRIQFDHGLDKPLALVIKGSLIGQLAWHGVEALATGAVEGCEGILQPCLRDAETSGKTLA